MHYILVYRFLELKQNKCWETTLYVRNGNIHLMHSVQSEKMLFQ